MRSIRWTTLPSVALLFAGALAVSAQEPTTPATPGAQTGADVQAPPLSRPPVRISAQIRPPRKTKDVKPVFPAEAQAKRVQGIVIMEATIDEFGKVREVKV